MDQAAFLSKPQKEQRRHSPAECAFAWMCLALGYLFCRAFPVHDNSLGAVLLFVFALVLTFVTLALMKAELSAISLLFAVISLVISVSMLFTQNGFLQFALALLAILSYTVAIYVACGNKRSKCMSDNFVLDCFYAAFIFPTRSANSFPRALISNGKVNLRPLLKIIVGLIIAFVPTAVIVLLLSYDQGFSELIEKATDFDVENVFSHLISLAFGVPVGTYIFGLFISSVDKKSYKAPVDDIITDASKALRIVPRLTAVASVLPILTVYVLFFISQLDYYVSAFTGVLPEGLIYADYARDGFFQLCAVSVINLLIIVALSVFIKRKDNDVPHVQRILCMILSVMTLVLISTALSKMFLYIDIYGLTPKRLYATWFIVVLAVIFVLVLLKQIIKKLPLIILSVIVVTAMITGLAFSQPDRFIAEYNVEHYINGDLDRIDLYALQNLGDSAVPSLVRLALYMDGQNGTDAVTDFPIILKSDNHAPLLSHYTEEYVKLCTTLNSMTYTKAKVWDLTLPELQAEKAFKKIGFSVK